MSAVPPVAYSKKWPATVRSGVILATTLTLGPGRIHTSGFALFTVASALCGMRRERVVRP